MRLDPKDHVYLSTSCLHNLHDRCKGKGAQCKFCKSACICECHTAKTKESK